MKYSRLPHNKDPSNAQLGLISFVNGFPGRTNSIKPEVREGRHVRYCGSGAVSEAQLSLNCNIGNEE
jgi:hypothetical protein